MNTIEEASRSKYDSEWPATQSYSRNVFLANCGTPRHSKESPEQLILTRMAKSYIELVSMGAVSCSVDVSFARLIQTSMGNNEQPKEVSRLKTSVPTITNILSVNLLNAFHAVLCLVPKSMKFEMVESLTQLVKQERNFSLVTALLPLLRQSIKFVACCRYLRPAEKLPGNYSVDSYPNDKVCSVYRSFAAKVSYCNCRT